MDVEAKTDSTPNKKASKASELARFKRLSLWPMLWPKLALLILACAHLFSLYINFVSARKKLATHEHYLATREVELHLMQEQGTTFRYLYGLASLTELKDHRMRSDMAIRKMRQEWSASHALKNTEQELFAWNDQLEKWRAEVFAQNVQPQEGRGHYQELMAAFQQQFMSRIGSTMPKREVYRIDVAAKSLSAFYLLRDELAHAVARNMPLSGPTLGQLMRKKAEIEHYAWWIRDSRLESMNVHEELTGSSWKPLNDHLVVLWQKGDQGNYGLLPKKIMDDTYDLEKELVMMFTHEMRGIQVVVKSHERFSRTLFLACMGVYLVFFAFMGTFLFRKWRALSLAYAREHRLSRHKRRTHMIKVVGDSSVARPMTINEEEMMVTLGAMRPFVFGVKQTLLKIKGTWAQMELSGATEGEVVLEELRPLWQKAYEESTRAMDILQESMEMSGASNGKDEGDNVSSLEQARGRRKSGHDIKKIAS